MRYAMCVEYDGTHFKGWQSQLNQRTVQVELEKAISKVADHAVGVVTAGRTDTAVHATAQMVHFDSDVERSLKAWCHGTNRFLPADIRVHWATPVPDEFHARFSALSRSYRYIIYNQAVKSALLRHHVTTYYRPLQVDRIQQAAQYFIGRHDFSSIRAAGCQAKTPVRHIHSLNVYSQGPWIWFDVRANAFLHHMVRNIAGMLIEVGAGERSVEWVEEVLAQRDRTKAGVTALPQGLYLTAVEYPEQFVLPAEPSKIAFWNE